MIKRLAAVLAATLVCGAAQATYTLTIAETSGDIVASGSGTLNLAGLTRNSLYDTSGAPFIQPGTATIWTGVGAAKFYDAAFAGPSGGWGSSFDLVDGAGSGDVVYMNASGLIGVSKAYVSGNLLNSSAIFASQTFASLGLTKGTYTYLFGSGANADSIVVKIGAPASPTSDVPELGSWALMTLGFGMIGAAMRRKRPALAHT